MNRLPLFFITLSSLSLVACGTATEETTTTTTTKTTEETTVVEQVIQPQSGEWTIVTTGWVDDECNAAKMLSDLTSVTFADVSETSFSITLFDGDVRIGDALTCTHAGGDLFDCTDFYNEIVPIRSLDATITTVGIPSVTLTSETDAAGRGELTLDCIGEDCNTALSMTGFTSFPCETTNLWTAVPE